MDEIRCASERLGDTAERTQIRTQAMRATSGVRELGVPPCAPLPVPRRRTKGAGDGNG